MEAVFMHTWKVIFYLIFTMFLNYLEHFFKESIHKEMMTTVKEDLLKSVIQAPVNTFYDLVPVSKIQRKLDGDVHCIIHLFWWCTWIIEEFVRTGTTVILITQADYSVLLALVLASIYLYNGQLYANKTRPEMNRAYCMFHHQVGQS